MDKIINKIFFRIKVSNLIIGCFLLFNFNSFCQKNELAKIFNSKVELEKKQKKFENFINQAKIFDSLNYYNSQIASFYCNKKKFDKSIFYTKGALKSIKNNKILDTLLFQKNNYKLGYYLMKNNQYLDAIEEFNKIINFKVNNEITAKTYYRLGLLHLRINDFTKSTTNFKIAITQNDLNINYIISSYINLTYILLKSNDIYKYKEGIEYCKKVDSLIKKNTISNKKKYNVKINLASFYNTSLFLDTKKSFKYYNEALEIANQDKDTSKIFNTLLYIGSLYNTTNFKKSHRYYNLAQKICKKQDSSNISKIYYYRCLTLSKEKKFTESIALMHQSFFYLLGNNLKNLNYNNKKLLSNYLDKKTIISMLSELAENYLKKFEETKRKEMLNKSVQYFKLADFVFDLLKLNISEFNSKLYWQQISSSIYSKAIKACFLNNNITDALYFMEKNKALLLMEDISNQNYKKALNIPNNLLKKELRLKKEILNLKDSLNLHKNDNIILKKINDSKIKLSIFQKTIYANNKKNVKTPTILNLKKIQKNIDSNTVYISYHISKDNGFGIYTNNDYGYAIFITKSKSFLFELNNIINFKNKIKEYLSLVKKPINTKKELEKLNTKSNYIFNKLFPNENIITNKKLIISSNDILSFLPFESLITNKKVKKYLIYNSEISYTYSMSFQFENLKTKRSPKKSFLGIAPIKFEIDSLSDLINSKKEITNIKKTFNGDVFLNKDATKQNYLLNSNDYNIIHFATHADISNDNEPWIAFKKNKLKLAEIYTIKNQSDLIVLSACNTSLGKIKTGEGVMSLARGFFYGGANSIVSSLWTVNDKSSLMIMTDFYHYLKKGFTKSNSLRQAKLNYLKKNTNEDISPYFWASFILIGDDNKLSNLNLTNYKLTFGFISFFLILLFFYLKRVTK